MRRKIISINLYLIIIICFISTFTSIVKASGNSGYEANVYINNVNIKNIKNLTLEAGEQLNLDIKLKKVGIVGKNEKIIIELPRVFSNISFNPINGFDVVVQGDKVIITPKAIKEDGLDIYPFGGYLKSKVVISDKIKEGTDKITVNNEPIKIKVNNSKKNNSGKKNNPPKKNNETNENLYKNVVGKSFWSYLYNGWNYWEQVEFNQLPKEYKYKLNINGSILNGVNGKIVDSIPWGMFLNKDTIEVYNESGKNVTTEVDKYITVANNQGSQSLSIDTTGFKGENYTLYYNLEITKELKDVIKVGDNRYLYNQVNFILDNKVLCSNWAQIEVMNLPAINTTLDKEIISSELYNHIGSELTYKLSIKGDQGDIKGVRAIDVAPKGTSIIPSSISVYQGGFGRQPIDVKVEKITSNNMVFKNATVVVNPEGTELYVYIPSTKYQNFYINYNLKVNALYPTISNKVIVYSQGQEIVKETIAKYEGTGGSMIAWKTVDSDRLTGNEKVINYKINLSSFGDFSAGYVNILDDLPKGLTIKDVNIEGAKRTKANYENGVYSKIEGGFNINYGKNPEGISFINAYNKGIISNGDSIILNIKAVIDNLGEGSTISNSAIINGNETNSVETKYGYGVKALKTSKEGVLEGAVFKLFNKDNLYLKDVESTSNGEINFSVESAGKYYLKEIRAPIGFILNEEKINFEIKESDLGTIVDIGDINNEKVKPVKKEFKIRLLKVNEENNEAIEGAEFKLFYKDGTFLNDLLSKKNGVVEFTVPKCGEYYLEEVKAPEGFQLNKDKVNFIIKEEDMGRVIHIGTLKNKKIEGKEIYTVKATKVAEGNKRALEEAIFEVFNEEGKYIKTVKSDIKGLIEFTLELEGNYYLKEIKAPKGFYLNKNKIFFKVSKTGENNEINIGEIKNKAILPKVLK